MTHPSHLRLPQTRPGRSPSKQMVTGAGVPCRVPAPITICASRAVWVQSRQRFRLCGRAV